MALSRCCCCGGLHSVLGEKRCVRTVCTVFALFCTVFALYLHRCFVRCSSCPISTLHCAGWAGLGWAGWAGVSVLCHREGSFSRAGRPTFGAVLLLLLELRLFSAIGQTSAGGSSLVVLALAILMLCGNQASRLGAWLNIQQYRYRSTK